MKPPSPTPRAHGNSPLPVIIIVAALALSAVVFFIFTKPAMDRAQVSAAPAPIEAAPAAAAPEPAPTAVASAAMKVPNEPITTASVTATVTMPTLAAKPEALAQQLTAAMTKGDVAAAAKVISNGDPEVEKQAAAVLAEVQKQGFKFATADQSKMLGQVGDATRFTIPLIKPGENLPSLTMQLDLVRDPVAGWRISQLQLPKELAAAVAPAANAPATAPAAAGKPSAPMFVVQTDPDPMEAARAFVDALLKPDLPAARSYLDSEKVPGHKLAGLTIVCEEGGYRLKASKPLVMTIASPTEAWVIAQLHSETLGQGTEFGLEMQRQPGQPWKISGLNLSDLLASFAKSSGALGVPYTPLVANPKGGESLALYYEYDRAELHPRAAKQLEIVAQLLKANPNRKLQIAGHTDSKGTDDYNISLSNKRALAVKLKLAALGVSVDQIVTEALGKASPLSPTQRADGTDDPEARSRNRRAEIYLDF